MRTCDDNAARILKRTRELQHRDRRVQARLIDAGLVAASFLLIIGLGLWMPRLSDRLGSQPVPNSGGTASLLLESSSLSYIMVAILSFFLGISLTVLLFRLKKRREHHDNNEL